MARDSRIGLASRMVAAWQSICLGNVTGQKSLEQRVIEKMGGGIEMKGYKVYLTKSREVAGLIAKAHSKEDYVTRSSYGAADHYEQVPEIYQEGYFACIIEYDSEKPEHRIEFA